MLSRSLQLGLLRKSLDGDRYGLSALYVLRMLLGYHKKANLTSVSPLSALVAFYVSPFKTKDSNRLRTELSLSITPVKAVLLYKELSWYDAEIALFSQGIMRCLHSRFCKWEVCSHQFKHANISGSRILIAPTYVLLSILRR